MKKRIVRFILALSRTLRKYRMRILHHVDHNPFRSFFIMLGTVFALIIISNILGSIKREEPLEPAPPKEVTYYFVGEVPTITVQAKIEKSGVVTLTSLAGGIVSKIIKEPGETFKRGQTLITISSNYQGGNMASLQRQLSQLQYDHTNETIDSQKELIQKQKDAAVKADANADELRAITDRSLQETRDLLSLNESILSTLDSTLSNLEQTNTNGSNDALILSTKQLKSQFLAATNGARQGLRNAEYQASGDKNPALLSDTQKDIALRQLDIQSNMLDLNREVSRIQLKIAQVGEATMYPSAPFSGTVQRVFVKEGQMVSPGTPLMVLSEVVADDPIVAVAYVSADIAYKASRTDKSVIHIDKNTAYEVYPTYISQDAVAGSLSAIYFPIPDLYNEQLTQNGNITVDIPIGYAGTTAFAPYVPVDAVYQTKTQSSVFISENGQVVSKVVELGQLSGSYVEVKKGLSKGDAVILDRTVIAGDRVR